MKKCKYFQLDKEAYEEQKAYMDYCASQGWEIDKTDFNTCGYCVFHSIENGFPGERLYCCNHPDNLSIVGSDSVFDHLPEDADLSRVLDSIV